jgi:hypothetical protein
MHRYVLLETEAYLVYHVQLAIGRNVFRVCCGLAVLF